MRSMSAAWTGSQLRFRIGNNRLPGVQVCADGPAPDGQDLGFMPTELFLGALGGCVGMNAVALLRKRQLPLRGLTVIVEGEQGQSWPKAFTQIDITFELEWDAEPDQDVVDAALRRAVHSYCPVGGTLSETVALSHHRVDVVASA